MSFRIEYEVENENDAVRSETGRSASATALAT